METKDEKIRNRESWLKVGIASLVTLALIYKFVTSPFNLSDFKFSELLALLLALFAIAMSVVFYVKASDTANTFYDNTYKFTNDMSEILGRIEAGFGEKLKHLDEGYTGLLTKIDTIPFDRKKVQAEVEQSEEEIKKVESERKKLIEDLADKARLVEKQKAEFLDALATKESELHEAKRQLERAQIQLRLNDPRNQESAERSVLQQAVLAELLGVIVKALGGPEWVAEGEPERVIMRFRSLWTSHYFTGYQRYQIQSELGVDDQGNLSRGGWTMIRRYAQQLRNERFHGGPDQR